MKSFLRWFAAGALRLLVGVVVFVVGSGVLFSLGWLTIKLGENVTNVPWLLPAAGLAVLIVWLGHLTVGLWSNDE